MAGAPLGSILLGMTIVHPILWIVFSTTFFPTLTHDNVSFRVLCILVTFAVSEIWIFHRSFTKIIVFDSGVMIKSFLRKKIFQWNDIAGVKIQEYVVHTSRHTNAFDEKSFNCYLKLKSKKKVYLTNSQNKHYQELLMIIKENLKNSYNE